MKDMIDTYLCERHSDDFTSEHEKLEAAKAEVAAEEQKKEDFFFYWKAFTEAMLGF